MKIRTLFLTTLAGTFASSGMHAAIITLTTGDAINTSSFANFSGNPTGFASNWSDSAFPSAGNAYLVTGGLSLRTPSTGTSYTFAGDSLTLGNGTTQGQLSIKTTAVFTINNFILNNASIGTNTDNITGTIAGSVSLIGPATFTGSGGTGRNVTVTAPISGAGALTLSNASTNGSTILAGTAANTYQGGTTVASSTGLVVGQKDGAFGTGNVTVSTGGKFRLELGTTNDYINDLATFSLAGTAVANLNFVGTDTVGALILGGVTQAPGIYSAANSTFFTGTGTITVIPEPGSVLLAIGGSATLLGFSRRGRRL